MRLKDKVCLITGGASGMGGQASRRFAREGAKVVIADLVEKSGRETVAAIEKEGGQALFVKTDVSREADCMAMVKDAVKRFGGIDVLYNNAGIFPQDDGAVTETPEAVWDKVLAVNLKGVAFSCKYGIPELIKRGGGSVINIASFVALVGCSVPQDAYTASKGAIHPFAKFT